jgi:predicted solute-binding protein
MDKDNKSLKKAIEEEIERVEHHMYNVLGMDRKKVEELYRRIDVELEKRLKEQFDNFAEIKR